MSDGSTVNTVSDDVQSGSGEYHSDSDTMWLYFGDGREWLVVGVTLAEGVSEYRDADGRRAAVEVRQVLTGGDPAERVAPFAEALPQLAQLVRSAIARLQAEAAAEKRERWLSKPLAEREAEAAERARSAVNPGWDRDLALSIVIKIVSQESAGVWRLNDTSLGIDGTLELGPAEGAMLCRLWNAAQQEEGEDE